MCGKEKSRDDAEALFKKWAVKCEGVGHIGPAEAAALSTQAVLVDVRGESEMKVSMLPGAVTKAEFEEKGGCSAHQGKTVIPYCTVGFRSGTYCKQLLEDAKKHSVTLRNHKGVLLWAFDQQPFVSGSDRKTPSTSVHTYNSQFNVLPATHTPVYYSFLRSILEWFKL